jgi:hypothetical protein
MRTHREGTRKASSEFAWAVAGLVASPRTLLLLGRYRLALPAECEQLFVDRYLELGRVDARRKAEISTDSSVLPIFAVGNARAGQSGCWTENLKQARYPASQLVEVAEKGALKIEAALDQILLNTQPRRRTCLRTPVACHGCRQTNQKTQRNQDR